jgi:hypothetical protein
VGLTFTLRPVMATIALQIEPKVADSAVVGGASSSMDEQSLGGTSNATATSNSAHVTPTLQPTAIAARGASTLQLETEPGDVKEATDERGAAKKGPKRNRKEKSSGPRQGTENVASNRPRQGQGPAGGRGSTNSSHQQPSPAARGQGAATGHEGRRPNPMTGPTEGEDDEEELDKEKKIVAERFRTKLCNKWLQTGVCPYDVRCMFAHGEDELRTTAMNLRDGLTTEHSIRLFKRTGVGHPKTGSPPTTQGAPALMGQPPAGAMWNYPPQPGMMVSGGGPSPHPVAHPVLGMGMGMGMPQVVLLPNGTWMYAQPQLQPLSEAYPASGSGHFQVHPGGQFHQQGPGVGAGSANRGRDRSDSGSHPSGFSIPPADGHGATPDLNGLNRENSGAGGGSGRGPQW